MTFAIPPADEIISTLRTSCHNARVHANIKIDDEQITRFFDELDEAEWTTLKTAHGVQRLPLVFTSIEEELDVYGMLSILNYLHGYRHSLHRLTTRGAWDTILSLVLSMHLSSTGSTSSFSAASLSKATATSVATHAQIPLHIEKPHPTLGPAVTVGERDPEALEICELVAGVLKQTGEILVKAGSRSLGAWLEVKLKEANGDAAVLVHELVTTFPAFQDIYEINGETVYLLKKAFFLTHIVRASFEERKDTLPFPLPQADDLPIFSDNVIPTMMVRHKLLDLSACTDPVLADPAFLSTPETSLLSSKSAALLRAAAVDACSVVTAKSNAAAEIPSWRKGMTEVELDAYLWSVAKAPRWRKTERFAERGTVFY